MARGIVNPRARRLSSKLVTSAFITSRATREFACPSSTMRERCRASVGCGPREMCWTRGAARRARARGRCVWPAASARQRSRAARRRTVGGHTEARHERIDGNETISRLAEKPDEQADRRQQAHWHQHRVAREAPRDGLRRSLRRPVVEEPGAAASSAPRRVAARGRSGPRAASRRGRSPASAPSRARPSPKRSPGPGAWHVVRPLPRCRKRARQRIGWDRAAGRIAAIAIPRADASDRVSAGSRRRAAASLSSSVV